MTPDGPRRFEVAGSLELDDGDVLTGWALAGRGIILKPVFEIADTSRAASSSPSLRGDTAAAHPACLSLSPQALAGSQEPALHRLSGGRLQTRAHRSPRSFAGPAPHLSRMLKSGGRGRFPDPPARKPAPVATGACPDPISRGTRRRAAPDRCSPCRSGHPESRPAGLCSRPSTKNWTGTFRKEAIRNSRPAPIRFTPFSYF